MTDYTEIPLDKIERLGHINLLDTDIFNVSWLLGRYCNFNCSYCWRHGRSDTKDHRPTELCLKTIDSIKEQARERGFNSFFFSFTGGEPIYHPGYFDILEHLANDVENCNYTGLHMTSNMSKNMRWCEQYLTYAKQVNDPSITASYHYEYVKNPKPWAEKLLFLQNGRVRITINIVMVPENFDNLYETAQFFVDFGLNATLKPQSNYRAKEIVEYTDKQLELLHNGMIQKKTSSNKICASLRLTDDNDVDWYMDQAERLNAFNFNNFKGWECSAGYRSLTIREPCGSVRRSHCSLDEPIGNIETGFKLHDVITECTSESCISSADSKIPKRKRGCKLPLWKINDEY